jgi:hypothetical protein
MQPPSRHYRRTADRLRVTMPGTRRGGATVAVAIYRRLTQLSPIFTVYVPRTSHALDVRGTCVIRPSDAYTQESDTWIPTKEFTYSVRGTFVPRTSGPLHDAEIKLSLISALSVRHSSVFLTQQTHVPSVAHTLHA